MIASADNCELVQGEALSVLRTFADRSIRCCVTSPPYWAKRDYGVEGQLGQEKTPEEFIERLVEILHEVKRVLTDDGTLWLNLGDSYAVTSTYDAPRSMHTEAGWKESGYRSSAGVPVGCKAKDLIGIPWMAAFALRADGWYLRDDIIWSKPNPLPESVIDRPTRSHEYMFLFSKSSDYYFDVEAIKEPVAESTAKDKRRGTERVRDYATAAADYGEGTTAARLSAGGAFGGRPKSWRGSTFDSGKTDGHQEFRNGRKRLSARRDGGIVRGRKNEGSADHRVPGFQDRWDQPEMRRKRDVWSIAVAKFKGAHFAVMPEKLVEPCVLAGSAPGDIILDPFCGSGTVGVVSMKLDRNFIGIDLNAEYLQLATGRINAVKEAA